MKALAFLIVAVLSVAFYSVELSAGSFEGRVIILDAGHGEGNTNIFAGYNEHVAMLALSHKIKPLLEAQGATVLLTRPCNNDVHLAVRAAKTNLWALEALLEVRADYHEIIEIDRLIGIMQRIIDDFGTYAPVYFNFPFDFSYQRAIHPDLRRIFELQADPWIRDRFLFISLHSNATPRPIDTSVNGAVMYIQMNDDYRIQNYFAEYANEGRSWRISDYLLRYIHEIGIQRRRISPGNWFVIREHNLPAVLAENGFHTNPHDRALLMCNEFLGRLAVAYYNAISRYFEYVGELPVRVQVQEAAITYRPDRPHNPDARFINRYMGLHTQIGNCVPSEIIGPQAVNVLEERDGWILICTWLGDRWVDLSFRPFAVIQQGFAIYAAPEFTAERMGYYTAGRVDVLYVNSCGWALIRTARGDNWAYLNADKRYTARTMRVFEYYGAAHYITTISPQVVTIYAQEGRWLQVGTWLGRKWIYTGESVYLDFAG